MNLLVKPSYAVILALLLGGSMWFYIDYVLVPHQMADAAAHGRPRGMLSDLYPRWLGARELLLHRRNPYSSEVTREIQAGYYGRALDPSRPQDPEDQQAFAYPVYVVFLLAPTVSLPFPLVQRGFGALLWLLAGASVLLWLRALRWRPRNATLAIFVILTLGSLPVAQAIKLQQLSLLVASLLAGSLAAVAGGYLVTSGVLLALATVKPQLAGLAVLWLIGWTLRDWRGRQRLIWSFGCTMLALLIASQVVLPGWIGHFVIAVKDYQRYTHNVSVLELLFGSVVGNSLAGILILISAALSWPLMKDSADSANFAKSLGLVMALSVVIVPMYAPYNQVLLLPVIMLLVRDAKILWQANRPTRVVCLISAAIPCWPWVASLGLMLASLMIAPASVQSAWRLPFITVVLVPIFMLGLALIRTLDPEYLRSHRRVH
jgi:hypothetical protein